MNKTLEISDIIKDLGVSAGLSGYRYLRKAIELTIENTQQEFKTMDLYHKVARCYNTTASRVERAIRHAIETAWLRVDVAIPESIFGNSIDMLKGKPTNREFIMTVADYIITHQEE